MNRTVTIHRDNNAIGSWRIACSACLLLPHTMALGVPALNCAAGFSTNMQGAITTSTCEQDEKESLKDEDGKLTLNCKKEDAA
jgi:hypothetical protein